MKDLERMAPKEKGITAQSVKEVVQSLVDDSLVDTDKIGTSIYFWAFPSKATHNVIYLYCVLIFYVTLFFFALRYFVKILFCGKNFSRHEVEYN